MQRDKYDAVTLEILVPASSAEKEGEAYANLWAEDSPIKVRRFVDEDLDRSFRRGKATVRQFVQGQGEVSTQNQILNLVELVRAIEAKDVLAMERATINLKSSQGPLALGITEALMKEPGYIESMLARDLSSRLDDVRLVMWQWQGRTSPALLCPDIATALLIRVVMSAVGARAGLRLCPKCGQIFLQKRQDQDYCSVKCREAHRVARWRAQKSGSSIASSARKKSALRRNL
jgi:hypothetical protein